MLSMVWVMFALSATHWIADLILLLRQIGASPSVVNGSANDVLTAIAKVNVSG